MLDSGVVPGCEKSLAMQPYSTAASLVRLFSSNSRLELGKRAQGQTQLIAPEPMRAEAIGKELKLFFYSVFHLAASAIEIFVQSPCCPLFSRQRGDHEAPVGSLVQMLGFPDYPAFSRPALAGLVTHLAKQASGLAR